MRKTLLTISSSLCLLVLTACQTKHSISIDTVVKHADILFVNGTLYNGELEAPILANVAICGNLICGIFPANETISASQTIDISGKIISPGFIDPHTHTLAELFSKDKNHNLNYLTQGVTTVINGNDGGSPVDIKQAAIQLEQNGIGTNAALFIGHNSIRKAVMGKAARLSTAKELAEMKQLVNKAMQDGALGLSSGLYYVPGNYANTDEVVSLATIASQYGGIYDTHLRDESTFNIGFEAALDEAINVAKQANIHLHLAHIKALGVDVWGQSKVAIDKISNAHQQGISISADQYPWLASGTKLHSAVMPKWVMADSSQAFHQRLNDPSLSERLQKEIKENIRRRGGASKLLITAFKNKALVGLTLAQVANQQGVTPVNAAINLVQLGEVRVASFNMSPSDVERFMVQPWVVTSSDGTNGHPRKYASFPKKYQQYVAKKKLLTLTEFIHRSSGKTAQILGLSKRGFIKLGYFADVIIFDPEHIKVNANFSQWDKLSSGMTYVLINGEMAIKHGEFTGKLAGQFLSKSN